jgi:hypothetical protein
MTQMDQNYNELRDEIAGLHDEMATMRADFTRGFDAMQINFQGIVKGLASELREISADAQRRVGFKEEYPTKYKMITGQLFHNEPNRTGKHGGNHQSEWTMKICFWTHCVDIGNYPNGTVAPYFFTMRPPADVTASPSSLLAEAIGLDAELVGCRAIKGTTKAKGTRLVQDQVALVFPSVSDGKYPARTLLIFSRGNEAIVIHEPFLVPESDHKKGRPVEIWKHVVD